MMQSVRCDDGFLMRSCEIASAQFGCCANGPLPYDRSQITGDIEVDIKVSGMVCDGCSGRVAEALKVSTTDMPQQRSARGFRRCLVAFGLAQCMQSIGRVLLLLLLLLLAVRLRSCSGMLSCCEQSWMPTCTCDAGADAWIAPAVVYHRACRRCTQWTST